METITAGEAIARVLRADGVRHVFGLPGGQVPVVAEDRLGVTWCILNDGAPKRVAGTLEHFTYYPEPRTVGTLT